MQSLIVVHDKHQEFPLPELSILVEQVKRWRWHFRTTGHQGYIVLQVQTKQKYTYSVQTCKELYRLTLGISLWLLYF